MKIMLFFLRSINFLRYGLDAVSPELRNETMESVRSDFTEEADANGLVGLQTARNPTHNFSLRHWSTELR